MSLDTRLRDRVPRLTETLAVAVEVSLQRLLKISWSQVTGGFVALAGIALGVAASPRLFEAALTQQSRTVVPAHSPAGRHSPAPTPSSNPSARGLTPGLLAGCLDSTFGKGGKVTTDFGSDDDGAALAIQPDGKLIVPGRTGGPLLVSTLATPALARYNPDGSLDRTFGEGGKVITDFQGSNDSVETLVIQHDGKIVAAGTAFTDVPESGVPATHVHFALARYNPDGSLDRTFGKGGKVITDFGRQSGVSVLAIQADGKLVAVGFAGGVVVLARYNPDGRLDPTFGKGGKVTTQFGLYLTGTVYSAYGLAIQADGKLIVAGNMRDYIALARYNPDGSLDRTFGSRGRTTMQVEVGNLSNAVVIQPNGRLVAAGTALIGPEHPIGTHSEVMREGDFFLARFAYGTACHHPG